MASTEELEEPVLELGRPGRVMVVDPASKLELLPNGWEKVVEVDALLESEVVEPPNGGVGRF